MKNLIREIHRRSLWQVLGIYVGVSWLVLQVVDVIIDNFGLPEWVAPFALVLLLIGLPVVLATAFVQEGVGSAGRPAADPARPPSPEPSAADAPGAAAEARNDDATSRSPGRSPATLTREVAPRGRGLFTWRNAVLGGASAFALLGVATGSYLALRALGIGPAGTLVAKGVLEERSPILVADFEGSDPELARAATDALRIDLGQSQVVTVVEPTEIAQVLRRMEREPDAALDSELAREVALREGIPIVVTGDVARAGEAYAVSARLIEAGSGTVLVSDRRTASGPEEVLDALDALSRRLRERIGESLRDLAREEPLARVTTASLPALEKYSAALRTYDLLGDEERSLALLEEAVALDTAFAMAWRKLGTILGNRSVDRARSVEALERAFAHRDRLTERERYQVEGIYHYNLGQDVPRAIQAYENLLELDPSDSYALNNLGVTYGYLREHERAREYYERSIAADSSGSLSYTNALQEMFALGRTDDARRMLQVFEARFPGNPNVESFGASLATATGDYETAERLARELLEGQPASPFYASEARRHLAISAAVQGRITDALDTYEETREAAAGAGNGQVYLTTSADMAGVQASTLGSAAAAATLEAALERFPLEDLPPLDRPYTQLALSWARAGRPERARALLDELDASVEPRLRSVLQSVQYDAARAFVALGEGRFEDAVYGARRADRAFCTICAQVPLAAAYDSAGRRDSATAAYRRYVETPWLHRGVALDQWVLATHLERLGQLYEEAGDLESAALFYAKFTELWADADEELQPRVRAARARLEEILRTRG